MRAKQIGFVALGILLVAPLAVIAGQLIFSTDWNVVMDDNGVEVVIESGSEAESISVDGDSLTVEITEAGDTVTIFAPEGNRLDNNAGLDNCDVDDGELRLVLSGIGTTVVTPSPSLCNEFEEGGGGGGGGGGGAGGGSSSADDEEEIVIDTREEAEDFFPLGLEVDDLVRASLPAVYYLGLDGKRHPFPNEQIYFSWYENFNLVQWIDDASLAEIPLGTPILSRPGTALIKIQSDPNVYAVTPGYVLRLIASEAIAIDLYGAEWARRVMDVEPTFFSHFILGEAVTAAEYPDGSLLRRPEDGSAVYYVSEGVRRPFVTFGAYQENFFQLRSIVADSEKEWLAYPEGEGIYGKEDVLFTDQMISP